MLLHQNLAFTDLSKSSTTIKKISRSLKLLTGSNLKFWQKQATRQVVKLNLLT